ncbi:MAG: hypothetical protein IPM96_06225 [Ignavibacteria bacterium]|nr:hypothetical protein [Ignavibacteria bacterium]
MTLKEFVKKFDVPDSIVLLEGKRKVLKEDELKLTALGKLLSERTKHILFRSGNADGSDYLFSKGVALVDDKRLQVITPYTGHKQKTNLAYETISLDEIVTSLDPEVVYESKKNKKTENMIEPYIDKKINNGGKKDFTVSAAYIIRDTVKVIGNKNNEVKPSAFGIFYDDLKSPMTGGTGHTMKVCDNYNVPKINQTVWFKWLEE